MSIENSCVRLDEGRWNPKNREVLEKLIEKYKKADNKKTVYFKLTKEGIVAYNNHEKFHAGFNEKLTAYLNSLSKKEFDAIARLAELVDKNIPDLSSNEGVWEGLL